MITIYGSDGMAKTQVPCDDNSTQEMELQGDNALSLSFTLYEHVALEVNDYAEFMGRKYWLMERYHPEQVSTVEWKYDIKLYGIESLVKRFLVINDTDGDDEPVFTLTAPPRDHVALLDIFEGHNIARRKLRDELRLFMNGERSVEKYREAGISWWDYCGHTLVNSYPSYFEKLPPLIAKINREKRSSKNYVLFLGSTDAETNQAPCLSLVQFQIDGGELVLSAYQRSSDANLGLPADIYHLYLMSRQIDLPLQSVTLNLGNVHIYDNNIARTRDLLAGNENIKFDLNV